MAEGGTESTFDSSFRLRSNPTRYRKTIRIGCGAGFAGDRIAGAVKLLKEVPGIDYLVLECLAERTLANRYKAMASGGTGYDPRITSWFETLLPVAISQGVRIISNMGATDPKGAQDEVLRIATELDLQVSVSVVYELPCSEDAGMGSSTYLGAAPIVQALETGRPNVILTSRVADAALFLAPMVYEFGWNWDQFRVLAQGTLAGHLLECGCQLTGGYFMHPADEHREFPLKQLLDVSLPYADIQWDGTAILGKAAGSGGELSVATCTQQLLYEIGDPAAYITPDVVVDFSNVKFLSISSDKVLAQGAEPSSTCCPEKLLRLIPKHCGTKGWGEISYGGECCKDRAAAADYLVRAWMEEAIPGSSKHILSYLIGVNSLRVCPEGESETCTRDALEVRLRMDGLFRSSAHAFKLTEEFEALYTNGPAGGGGISTGHQDQVMLSKVLVRRDGVFWRSNTRFSIGAPPVHQIGKVVRDLSLDITNMQFPTTAARQQAPEGVAIPLFLAAHCRTGDKGDQLNVSIIPHCPADMARLQVAITPEWVLQVVDPILKAGVSDKARVRSSKLPVNEASCQDNHAGVKIYPVKGVSSLNVVIANVLDGGVTCSRRLDGHGKALSDLFLKQLVELGPRG